MSDPADLTHGVLLRVADFLRRLPADQLAELADGSAKLEVVPKGGRRPRTAAGTAAGTSAGSAKPLPISGEQARAELVKIGDRPGARRWLADQGLTVPQLRHLAGELGITVPAKARKDDALDQLVQGTIGRRLDFDAISRPAPARF